MVEKRDGAALVRWNKKAGGGIKRVRGGIKRKVHKIKKAKLHMLGFG